MRRATVDRDVADALDRAQLVAFDRAPQQRVAADVDHDLGASSRRGGRAGDERDQRVGRVAVVRFVMPLVAVGGAVAAVGFSFDPVHERGTRVGREPEVPAHHPVTVDAVPEGPQRLLPLVPFLAVTLGREPNRPRALAQVPHCFP